MKVSIVIPAKNEEKRLPKFLTTLTSYCSNFPHQCEIIVVDDGSTDGTVQEAALFQKQFPNLKILSLDRNHGKGYAVKQGFKAAKGDILLFLDADGSTGPEEIGRYLHLFEQGYDIVIGSRALYDHASCIKARSYRKWMGAIFNFLVSHLLIKGIRDTQCGFKMFRAAVARDIFNYLELEGFGFDLEVLYIAQKKSFRIKEVSVNWVHVDGSKVDVLKDSFKMFCNILEIRKLHKSLS